MSQACALFLCCERPAWQTTATPVGMCVSRTADSVLLTCWPPAPPERMVSMRTSDFGDVDLDAVVDHRKDRDRRKRGVPARVGIERRDPHQPVHAGFGLQPAIGVVARDLDGGGLDAGFFALGLFQIFDLEAVLLGPARVHAQQHRGPVLAFGAAGAGVDFEIGVEAVGFAAEQRFELAAGDFLLQGFQRGLGLRRPRRHRSRPRRVRSCRHCPRARARPCRCRCSASSSEVRSCISFCAFCGIVPEIGIFGELVQLGQARRGCIDVKDASSAARQTA